MLVWVVDRCMLRASRIRGRTFWAVTWIAVNSSLPALIPYSYMGPGFCSLAASTIGIPQVAYQSVKQSAVDWIDVYHRLTLEGIYFLSSRTSSESVGHLVGSLLYGGGDTSRALCINGSGGDVFSGSSVGDWMQQGTTGITTVILGTARSIACVIALMGFIRYGLVHWRLIFHSAEALSSGTIYLMQRLTKHFSRLLYALQRSSPVIHQALGGGYRCYLPADLARNLGVIYLLGGQSA